MFGDIVQPTHLLLILVVALVVLGPKRLPEVGRTLGSGIRDFRQALSGETPDRPQAEDPGQVPGAATELRHQPGVDDDLPWPEDAIGPTTYDEPVEAASAEPADIVDIDTDPGAGTHPEEPTSTHADQPTSTHVDEPTFTHADEPAPVPTEEPVSTASDEDPVSAHAGETRDSSESSTDQTD